MKDFGETYTVSRNREVALMAPTRRRWGLPRRTPGYVEIADINDGLVVMPAGGSWLLLDLFRVRQSYPWVGRPPEEMEKNDTIDPPGTVPALPPFRRYKAGLRGQIPFPASAGNRWDTTSNGGKVREFDLGGMVLITPLDKSPTTAQELSSYFVSPLLQQAARAPRFTPEMALAQDAMYRTWCKKLGSAVLNGLASPYMMHGNGLAEDESLLGRTLEAHAIDSALRSARHALRVRNPDVPSLKYNE
jgi:hypothetical protein